MLCHMTSIPIKLRLLFFFNDTATTEIYTLSLHDALPILLDFTPAGQRTSARFAHGAIRVRRRFTYEEVSALLEAEGEGRSEEHTSELQSRQYLVCRPLLEKKKRRDWSLLSYPCISRCWTI